MADNPRKKKRDSKRFSATQKHEIDYVVKKAKELKKLCEDDMKCWRNSKSSFLKGIPGISKHTVFPTITIRRICIAVLKLSKKGGGKNSRKL